MSALSKLAKNGKCANQGRALIPQSWKMTVQGTKWKKTCYTIITVKPGWYISR